MSANFFGNTGGEIEMAMWNREEKNNAAEPRLETYGILRPPTSDAVFAFFVGDEGAAKTRKEYVAKLFRRLEKLQKLIERSDLPKAEKSRLKGLIFCHRAIIEYGNVNPNAEVGVHRTDKYAFYSGLVHCTNAWSCPVDSFKILSARCQEIDEILDIIYEQKKLQAVMVTFTAPHTKNTKFVEFISAFKFAMRGFKAGRKFQSVKSVLGLKYTITGFESTYGRNGLHFHSHQIWIVEDVEKFTEELEKECKAHWMEMCRRFGIEVTSENEQAFLERGFVLSRDKNGKPVQIHSGKYLCGFGGGRELSSMSSKVAKNGNRTMWELLDSDDAKDNKIFLEYALATAGKGRIVFSKGLRQFVNMEQEKTDEDIVNEEIPESELVAMIEEEDWYGVLDAEDTERVPHARAEILETAFNQGYGGLSWYCLQNFNFIPRTPEGYVEVRKYFKAKVADEEKGEVEVVQSELIAKIAEEDWRKVLRFESLGKVRGYDALVNYCLENFGFIPSASEETRQKMEDEMTGGEGCVFE